MIECKFETLFVRYRIVEFVRNAIINGVDGLVIIITIFSVIYRPISLTCILCKILESLVRKVILNHTLSCNLLSKRQFGFINGRSTTLQLLHYLDKCIESVARGQFVDVIYFSRKLSTWFLIENL